MTINTTPRHQNQLCHPELAEWLWDTVEHRIERNEWYIHLLLLMPDHLHAVMSFPREQTIAGTIGQWKRYVSREKGITWQRDFFEHRLRNDENLVEKCAYIRMNPVRQGLCKTPETWPYIWTPKS
ncbi:MAG: transposase [Verrucomicrobia bacterium]|nr:transposase [Kiritimatiellia bacterium]MCO6400102.1 transposase [Verrucomicrobiota bacterium]